MPGVQIGMNLTTTIPETEIASSGKAFNVLDTCTDHRGRVWMFVHANGAITAAGYVVIVDELGEAVMVTATNAALGDRLGVAPYAFADNDYGWVQVYGVCDAIRTSAAAVANTGLLTTATAGALDDTAGTDQIGGLWLTTATGGAATGPGFLNWPMITVVT